MLGGDSIDHLMYEAKARRAAFDGLPEVEMTSLMEAGLWAQAHDCFMRKRATHLFLQSMSNYRLESMVDIRDGLHSLFRST